MMKVAFIGSIADIDSVHALGSIDMALTHLFLESKPYRDHFIGRGNKEWILDNSIMELGDSMAADTVLSVAREYYPDIVVAPDSFNNKKETIARTTSFINMKHRLGGLAAIRVMGVAHGKDWDDWKDCFIAHQQNGQIGLVGIPYGTTFEIPGVLYRDKASKTAVMMDNRLAMTSWIAKNTRKPKPCHLLGASDPRELYWQKNHQFIYSHDSSSAYACGVNGLELVSDKYLGREKFKMDFNFSANYDQLEMVKKNVSTILNWVK